MEENEMNELSLEETGEDGELTVIEMEPAEVQVDTTSLAIGGALGAITMLGVTKLVKVLKPKIQRAKDEWKDKRAVKKAEKAAKKVAKEEEEIVIKVIEDADET